MFWLQLTEYLHLLARVKGSAAVTRNPTIMWLKNEFFFHVVVQGGCPRSVGEEGFMTGRRAQHSFILLIITTSAHRI